MRKYIFIVLLLCIFYAPARVILIDHVIGYRVFITNQITGDQVTFLRLDRDNYIIVGKQYFLPDTNYVKVGFSFNNEPGLDLYWNMNDTRMDIVVHKLLENKLYTTRYRAVGSGYYSTVKYNLHKDTRTSLFGGYNLFTTLGMYDLFYSVNGVPVSIE